MSLLSKKVKKNKTKAMHKLLLELSAHLANNFLNGCWRFLANCLEDKTSAES